ncbi:unnamed protein product [Linum tenue]|uniref:Uncharacterized protein n=1 Tax=Linum tenue TaxID=586396 RepID=A0AAV0IDS4_9ROSI|nr:unnamed protein product [Linum tenue]
MERSEPTLVPEWLRTTGSVSGGGSSAHHFASSSSHSDHSRTRNSKSTSDFDSPRLAFLDRTSSSNSRRSSSNGSGKHAYSSFSRNHRDKERDRDKDRLSFTDHWDRDPSDSLGSLLTIRNEKDTLRRSHSMVTRKQSDVLSRRVASDLKNRSSSSNHVNGNGLISDSVLGSTAQKTTFEKDFPSLGTEERPVVPDVVRVSSPGLSNGVQSLSVGISALISGEGWTSALAEAPPVVGTISTGSAPTAQVITSSGSAAPTAMAGLNMAEALTQAPSRARTTPQLSVQTQRLEELAIKQSRQLIPVTPSLPKSSVLNASDKLKPKGGVRSGEMNMVKNLQQQQQQPPSFLHPTNQSLLGGKSEVPKTTHGKLFILKPGRENGVSASPKDVASPTNSTAARVLNAQQAAAAAATSVVASVAPRSPINPPKIFSGGERKSNAMIPGFSIEKKPSLSQAQSRNDFFNLLKKKTSGNASMVVTDSSTGVVSSAGGEEKSNVALSKEPVGDLESSQALGGRLSSSNGGSTEPSEEVQRFSEEEAAFLRSLGWEETSGEDEGLTEEEINAFYQEYMKLKPSPKVNGQLQ